MRAVELFCGGGLSSIGLVRAGCELVGGCDTNERAVTMFNSQSNLLPPVAQYCDVDQYTVPECDLLSGGPVCKAFSPGATAFGTKGKADGRNTFPHFFRALERVSPDYVLIENSFGLFKFKAYLDEILGRLARYGYKVDCAEIDCFDYGVSQHRRRVLILGSKKGEWPITKPEIRLGPKVIRDCFLPPIPAKDPWPLYVPCTIEQVLYLIKDERHFLKHYPLEPDKPSSTITASYSKGVPYGVMRMGSDYYMVGPRLVARLQGLPDEYVFKLSKAKTFEILGNGFPPQVIEWVVGTLTGTRTAYHALKRQEECSISICEGLAGEMQICFERLEDILQKV